MQSDWKEEVTIKKKIGFTKSDKTRAKKAHVL
jgi:hypothetical protein